jgi:hypothetical protein
MTYQDISKRAVDTAAPLEFPERSARQELTITIKANIGGFDTEICFSGQLDQLEAITRRLRDLGASPAGVHQLAPNPPARKPKAERVSPAYDGNGDPCCPKHTGRVLKEGQFGLYCSAKDDSQERGYCALKFKD